MTCGFVRRINWRQFVKTSSVVLYGIDQQSLLVHQGNRNRAPLVAQSVFPTSRGDPDPSQ
jgi:hypothetical protein